MTDWRDLGLAFVFGLVVGYLLREYIGATTQAQALQNEETWDMKELPDGSIRVEVHRKIHVD